VSEKWELCIVGMGIEETITFYSPDRVTQTEAREFLFPGWRKMSGKQQHAAWDRFREEHPHSKVQPPDVIVSRLLTESWETVGLAYSTSRTRGGSPLLVFRRPYREDGD